MSPLKRSESHEYANVMDIDIYMRFILIKMKIENNFNEEDDCGLNVTYDALEIAVMRSKHLLRGIILNFTAAK